MENNNYFMLNGQFDNNNTGYGVFNDEHYLKEGEFIDGKLVKGKIIYKNSCEEIIKEGTFINEKLVEGKYTLKESGCLKYEYDGKFNNESLIEGIKTKYYTEIQHCGFNIDIAPNNINYEYNTKKYIGTFDGIEELHGEGKILNRHGTVIYSGYFHHGLWFDGKNKYYNPEYDVIVFEGTLVDNNIIGYGKYYGYDYDGILNKYIEGFFEETDINIEEIDICKGKFSIFIESYGWDNGNGDEEKFYDCEFIDKTLVSGKKIVTTTLNNEITKYTYLYNNKISTLIEYIDKNNFIHTGTFNSSEVLHGKGQIKDTNNKIKFEGDFYYGLWFDGKNKLYNSNGLLVYESLDDKLFGNKVKLYKDGLLRFESNDITENKDTFLCKLYKDGKNVFDGKTIINLSVTSNIHEALLSAKWTVGGDLV